jgi:hypothetical protein
MHTRYQLRIGFKIRTLEARKIGFSHMAMRTKDIQSERLVRARDVHGQIKAPGTISILIQGFKFSAKDI